MNLGKSVVYSVAVHAFIIALLLFIIPAPEKKKAGGEFFTDLVSPEELLPKRPSLPPRPDARAVPPTPSTKMTRMGAPRREAAGEHTRKLQDETGNTGTAPPSPNVGKGSGGESAGENRPAHKGSVNQEPGRVGPTLKEKLFDTKVIGDLARRDLKKGEKKSTFTFDADEYRLLVYNRRLKERIESIWHYPPDAAARGIYGDLVIRFTIKRNGQLGAVELVRTSGHKNLDDAAMEALKDGAPYWPLPKEWEMDAYTIEGHFVYSLYGYYIR